MNSIHFFDASDKSFDNLLILGFVVVWIALKLGSRYVISRSRTIDEKVRWQDRLALLAGTMSFAFIAMIFASSTKPNAMTWLLTAGIGVVIIFFTWLRIRNNHAVAASSHNTP